MKKPLTLGLLSVALALPLVSQAWVAYSTGGYGGVAYSGAAWRGGWSCGGVTTGTPLAAGTAVLVTGSTIASSGPQGGQVISAATEQGSQYVSAATEQGGQYVSAATEHGSQYVSAATQAPPPLMFPAAPIGSICYVYPSGVRPANINGVQYYVLGNNYYRAYFGNNGVYYQVVANPT